MKKFFLALLLIITCNIYSQNENINYESLWEGKLKIGNSELNLALKIYKTENEKINAHLDSPDQGQKNISVTTINIKNDSLLFEIKNLNAKFEGKFTQDKKVIEGTFSQSGYNFPLTFFKVDKLTEVKRPQLPSPPFPYKEEEIFFENKDANIILAGTLTIPKEGNNFPSVVLVSGSGPQDRDETLMGHKPFLVIADYLARNGIAVLRFDDRGVGKSKGNFSSATTFDFASDVLSAIEYLKSRKELNHKKIGIIGHSEGGLIAPICAVNSNDVSFIVLLAGPGVSGKEILLLQTELILKANGVSQDDILKTKNENEKIYSLILSESDSLTIYNKLIKLRDEEISKMSEEEKKKPENSKEFFERQIKSILSPWFRTFVKYDPRPILEQITIPVLALNGEKDLQVAPYQNLPEIEKALIKAGNKNYKIVELPKLNHLFQPCETGSVNEYAKIEITFSVDALKLIKDWIWEIVKN
ncbi:MAG: alpha/beta fold hydrolase [Melioribacteraceae bacterium]|nr:alpha/beta fold hydrolase [Melioribacteraceae bacterium]